jgi:hypothetical protein
VKVLNKVDEGLSIAVFRHQYYGANKSAVFSFKKNEDQIRGNIKSKYKHFLFKL